VKKCAKCQEFGPLHHTRPEELHSIISPWPFVIWGMNIIGPFSPRKGQTKFLLVGVDYFTKWIEVEPLASISAKNVQNFVWRSIVCRFGVPHMIITDNGRQFIDRGLQSFYDDLGIKSITTSVEHPQTNGQAEESLAVNLDLVSEFRDKSRIQEAACKVRASRRYNTKVRPRSFQKGDLVWRMRSDARKNEGKFSSNWDGPFRVREVAQGGAYNLK